MFKALMAVQWKWSKAAALLATVVGFAIPLASVQSASATDRPLQFVMAMDQFGVPYALVAAGVGLAFALLAWGPDHRGRHVYALSLPISRARYAGIRFTSGLLFLLAPMSGVLVGTLLAVAIAPIPPGLHAYPVALTLRFFFASCVAFAIFFAIASSTTRMAGIALGVIATIFVVQFVLSAAHVNVDVVTRVYDLVFSAPGILSVFTGRWMLIDV